MSGAKTAVLRPRDARIGGKRADLAAGLVTSQSEPIWKLTRPSVRELRTLAARTAARGNRAAFHFRFYDFCVLVGEDDSPHDPDANCLENSWWLYELHW